MKIARIETIPLAIPHDHGGPPPAWGGQAWQGLSILLVRVETEDGANGWGEAFSYNCMPAVQAVVDATVAPILIGRDCYRHRLAQPRAAAGAAPLRPLRHHHVRHLRHRHRALGPRGQESGACRSGSSSAGRLTPPLVPGYASLLKYRDRELVATAVRAALDEGYPAIKLHETGEPEIAAAREAMGADMPLCTDTNCPWTPAEALTMAARLKAYDLYWLEEPNFPPEDFAALARLQQESGVDLACGENACTAFEFRRMLDAGAVRYVQPSVTKVGGVTEFLKVLALAEGYGVTVMPHSPYFGPGWLATLQLLGAMPLTGRPGGGWAERFYTRPEATLYPGLRLPGRERPLPHPHRPRPRRRARPGRHPRLSGARVGPAAAIGAATLVKNPVSSLDVRREIVTLYVT